MTRQNKVAEPSSSVTNRKLLIAESPNARLNGWAAWDRRPRNPCSMMNLETAGRSSKTYSESISLIAGAASSSRGPSEKSAAIAGVVFNGRNWWAKFLKSNAGRMNEGSPSCLVMLDNLKSSVSSERDPSPGSACTLISYWASLVHCAVPSWISAPTVCSDGCSNGWGRRALTAPPQGLKLRKGFLRLCEAPRRLPLG